MASSLQEVMTEAWSLPQSTEVSISISQTWPQGLLAQLSGLNFLTDFDKSSNTDAETSKHFSLSCVDDDSLWKIELIMWAMSRWMDEQTDGWMNRQTVSQWWRWSAVNQLGDILKTLFFSRSLLNSCLWFIFSFIHPSFCLRVILHAFIHLSIHWSLTCSSIYWSTSRSLYHSHYPWCPSLFLPLPFNIVSLSFPFSAVVLSQLLFISLYPFISSFSSALPWLCPYLFLLCLTFILRFPNLSLLSFLCSVFVHFYFLSFIFLSQFKVQHVSVFCFRKSLKKALCSLSHLSSFFSASVSVIHVPQIFVLIISLFLYFFLQPKLMLFILTFVFSSSLACVALFSFPVFLHSISPPSIPPSLHPAVRPSSAAQSLKNQIFLISLQKANGKEELKPVVSRRSAATANETAPSFIQHS